MTNHKRLIRGENSFRTFPTADLRDQGHELELKTILVFLSNDDDLGRLQREMRNLANIFAKNTLNKHSVFIINHCSFRLKIYLKCFACKQIFSVRFKILWHAQQFLLKWRIHIAHSLRALFLKELLSQKFYHQHKTSKHSYLFEWSAKDKPL